jgi:hypothetical protein
MIDDTISSVPDLPEKRKVTERVNFKPATPDMIEFDNSEVPVDFMTDLIFENIGGQEIISISRNDLINGQSVTYNPIRNATLLSNKYGPGTIIPIPDTTDSYFEGKAIRLSDRIPDTGSNAYVDPIRGDLVVEVTRMSPGDVVEIEVLYGPLPSDDIIWSED